MIRYYKYISKSFLSLTSSVLHVKIGFGGISIKERSGGNKKSA